VCSKDATISLIKCELEIQIDQKKIEIINLENYQKIPVFGVKTGIFPERNIIIEKRSKH